MKQVKLGGVVKMGYRYNARGERVAAINADNGPVTTYSLYDEGGQWIGDYDSNGAAVQQAIWMGNAPTGLLADAGATQSLKYVQSDHLGTPRSVIDPTRNVAVWAWDAKGEVFGNSPPNQDPDMDNIAFSLDMRFPGQRKDSATGMNYNYFRDGYDPGTGRYSQPDPIGLDGDISLYAYAKNNPARYLDPTGLIVKIVASDPKIARSLMRAYGELNYRSATARSVNDYLEQQSTVYEIRYKKGRAFYCNTGQEKDCDGRAHTIFIDPCHSPGITTTAGEQPIPLPIMLGHELGHAFGYDDNISGSSVLGDNVEMVENPIRRDFGLPLRNWYLAPAILPPVTARPTR